MGTSCWDGGANAGRQEAARIHCCFVALVSHATCCMDGAIFVAVVIIVVGGDVVCSVDDVVTVGDVERW